MDFNDCVHVLSKDTLPARKYLAMRLDTLMMPFESREISMRRQLDSARQGFQRLRVRLLYEDTLPAKKYLAMRLSTFALLERWFSMAVWIPDYSISQRRLNFTSMDPTIACTSYRAKAPGTDATAESESLP